MRESQYRSRRHVKTLRKNLTSAERKLWNALRAKRLGGHRFRRQHPVGPYIADFANIKHRLIIEIDGDTHGSPEDIAYDKTRTAYLEAKGWRLMRCWNSDVRENISGVCDTILLNLGQ